MVKSLQRKWNRWLSRRMTGWLRQELRQYPMAETLPEDIFLISYPKSGNTWFRYLTMSVVYGVSPAYAPKGLLEDLSPDVHQRRFYHRFASPMFIKSHSLPQPQYRRVVYLVRDGRDALVSYLHYARNFEHRLTDDLTAARTGAGLPAGQWHQHVEQWLANPHGAELLLIRYEDLLRYPVEQMERFCAFAGLSRPREVLEWAVEECRFQNLRQREEEENPALAGKPRDAHFFRRGEAGSYRSELSPECLRAFEETAWPTLRRLGYVVGEFAASPADVKLSDAPTPAPLVP